MLAKLREPFLDPASGPLGPAANDDLAVDRVERRDDPIPGQT